MPATTDDSGAPQRKRALVDLAPLRVSPTFARLWIGSSIQGIGSWLTLTAVGLLIYDITQSTFMVALVGGIALVPMVAAGIWGGMLADAFDRRTVAITTTILGWLSTLGLFALALTDGVLAAQGVRVDVWPLYIFTTINAVTTTMTSAARTAAIPRILPVEYVSRATALNGITMGTQVAVGPALAGIMIAGLGYPLTFLIDVILFTAGFIGIIGLPKLPPIGQVAKPGLQSLIDGVRFLRTAPNIRMSFIVDIIAMSLGRPHALFPAIGVLAIGGGSVTVGFLTAAMAIGTLLTGLFSGRVAHVHRHGVAISWAIMVYGVFTALFGLVVLGGMLGWFGETGEDFSSVSWTALILAFLALLGTGAADEVSAIFRATMLLTAVPDEMRGRTQGLFMAVVAGGPRLGDLVAGTTVALLTLWAPPLFGGVVIIALIALLLRLSPRWRAYDARNPTV
ncbi:MFS transporter [Pseudoclavibacter endophyticus]|uniref:MFS transporter n=1 Tax=Pseudoclavibacter endophyticus TaxID=1778590 RepID=A0A6H9WNM4_9MICO|nr:MFS transporter [Pseudoclavibacter endophyticus]KAB1646855.1 MFS transporter [Pseudoclavibacter endophyticus]GGA74996.1 MFS transporter [Pseudoclavibacter endophyticus]